jgi:ubiquinone/menaquinone biosynthesis C-methylase UbiE
LNERRYNQRIEQLRSPERVAFLEVERVVQLALEGPDLHTVLDVGTGSGIFAQAFAERGLKVTGMDANPAMLEAAQSYVPDGAFRLGVAEDLPFSDQSFDLISMVHVLHETDDALKALQEAHRVAKRRVVVVEWPYHEDTFGPPLAHRISSDQIIDLARKAGFTTPETFTLSHMVMVRLSV